VISRSVCCCIFLLASASFSQPGSSDLAAALAAAESPELSAGQGYRIENVALEIGLARLSLHKAILIPAQPIGDRPREFVLLGSATLTLEPPTEVEAHQLELFTGRRRFREAIEDAVFVLSNKGAVDAIQQRPRVQLSDQDRQRASALFDSWRASGERRRLSVDAAIVRGVAGDPGADSFFAGWFDSERLGRFLYRVDPWQREQASLGQFVPIDLSAREEKKLRRYIHKQQRQQRLVNLEVEDLGTWNTWVEESLRVGERTAPGSPGYEPSHYEIAATLDPRQGSIVGSVKVRLERDAMAGRAVSLLMDPNVVVDEVRQVTAGEPGAPLLTAARGAEMIVFLEDGPGSPAPVTELEISFRGDLLERMAVGGVQSYYLDSTLNWYPHTGNIDLATYDLHLQWPKKFEVLAPGKRTEASATERGHRAARWQLDRASFGITFEIGEFRLLERKIGQLAVTLALDEISAVILNDTDVLFDYIERPLQFLQKTFGALPYDQMTFVTAPREFSQSLSGFITLSTLMMTDDAMMYLVGSEDPRTVIAHEIAHQWWGHRVGWLTDRDQWLSESLADYSAELFARRELVDLGGWSSPTSGWRDEMAQPIGAVRLGDLGPVVMGARLNSSLSEQAYTSIAYKKGAVVLQMLSRRVGEDAFNQALARLAEQVDGRPVSTDEVVSFFEQTTGVDLGSFSDDFIYGTRMPDFSVSYDVRESSEEGRWQIEGRIAMQPSLRQIFRVVELNDGERGGLDVETGWVNRSSQTFTPLVVPVRIRSTASSEKDSSAKRSAENSGSKRRNKSREDDSVKSLGGLFRLDSQNQEFSLPIEFEAESITFDPEDQVYATFRDPGPVGKILDQGREALMAGEIDQAIDLLRSASRASGEDEAGRGGDELDDLVTSRLELVRLLVARRALDEAEAVLAEVRALTSRDTTTEWLYEADTATQEARLLLSQNRARAALKKLEKAGEDALDVEGTILMILAAREVGDQGLAAEIRSRHRVEFSNVLGVELLDR
jgi:hypothetical protein